MAQSHDGNALAQRRQRLAMQAAMLRGRFAAQVGALEPALLAVDQARAGMRWIRRHPAVVVAALLGFALSRPRRAMRWLGRAWFLWQLVPAKTSGTTLRPLATGLVSLWRRWRR